MLEVGENRLVERAKEWLESGRVDEVLIGYAAQQSFPVKHTHPTNCRRILRIAQNLQFEAVDRVVLPA